MNAKTLTIFVIGILLGLSSCSEEDITASEDNRLIAFPQGTNSYDAVFRWQITEQLGYVSRPADEQYVESAVRFIKTNCFRFYAEDSLKAYLPYRIYLARDLGKLFDYSGLDAAGNNVSIKDTIWHISATNGYANLCIGLANNRLARLSEDSLRLAKGEINAALLANAISQGNIQVPSTFAREEVGNVVWYNYIGSYNAYGLLEYIDAKTMTPAQDFVVFLKYLIAYPTDVFEEKYATKAFDTSGRIARKAKIVRSWMLSEYGIDLEAMAEAAIER